MIEGVCHRDISKERPIDGNALFPFLDLPFPDENQLGQRETMRNMGKGDCEEVKRGNPDAKGRGLRERLSRP